MTELNGGFELEDVIHAIGDGAVVLDGDRIRTVVDTGTPTLGYSADQLRGDAVTTLFAPDPPAVFAFDVTTAEAFRQAVRDPETTALTVPIEAADGTVVPCSISVLAGQGQHEFVCLLWDRTNEFYAGTDITGLLGDPVFVLDADNRFRRVNDAMVEQTGYERRSLIDRDIGELVPGQAYDTFRTRLTDLVDTVRDSETIELPIVTSDGEVIVTEAHVTVFTDENGAYAGSAGVLRDITERKRREQNLDLLKQIFTRVFRHNIRNRLVVTNGHAMILDEELDEDHRVHTQKIIDSTEQLLDHSTKARLIEQVVTTDDQYEIDLTAAVETLVADARERYPDAAIDVDLPESFTVRAHAYIDRAIEELLTNAIEHAPTESARVSIWADRDTLFIEDESGGLADHELRVLKTGTESDLEHSSGVGLWLVRWLVEYSEGKLIAHRTDEGTLMGIRFDSGDSHPPDIEGATMANTPRHVRDVAPERFRGETVIERVETLDRLEDRYERLERQGAHTVLITGEAGIGKTTLVEQFCERLADRSSPPVVAKGVCETAFQPPYHGFKQALEDLPTERNVTTLLSDAASLSADDADELEQRKRALFADIADQVRSVATDRPVVLVLEDVQWADSGTIELFEYLVDEIGRWGRPVMFVGTYRFSDVQGRDPVLSIAEETADSGRGSVLELEPLETDEIRRLLSSIFDIETVPPSFVEAVAEHTGGTPLFVTELGRHLAGTLGPIQAGRDLPETLDELTVPETVERAITERLETLPESVRPVLETGAVIGREFSFDVLREASDRPIETVIGCIDTLVQHQIWSRSADGIEFVHGVVREQTLATIEDDDRDRLHERVATAIEAVYADSIDEHAARLGTHYERIGEYPTAFEYYQQAGRHAFDTYAHDDAIDHYERALSIGQDHDGIDETAVATVTIDLGDVFELLGEYDRAHDCYETSVDQCRECGDRSGEARALNCLGTIASNRRAYDRASECFDRSLDISRELGDRKREAENLTGLGDIADHRGTYDDAIEYYEESLEICREIGDRSGEATALKGLAEICVKQSNYERGETYFEQSLEICREIGDRSAESASLNGLGAIATSQSAYSTATEYYEQSLRIRRSIGDRQGASCVLHNLGLVSSHRGAYEHARDYEQQSLEIRRAVGDPKGEATNLSSLGRVELDQGNYGTAQEYVERSLEIYRELGNRLREAVSLHNLGIITAKQSEYDRARDYHEQALDIFRSVGDRNGVAVCLYGFGAIAFRQGAYDQATEYCEESLKICREIGDRKSETRCLLILGRIATSTGRDDDAHDHVTDALDIARAIDASRLTGMCLRELGTIARKQTAYEQAADYLDDSLSICDEIGNANDRGNVHVERARLALARDDPELARNAIERATEAFSGVDAPHDEAQVTVTVGRIAAADGRPDDARDHWQTALETFEALTAPQDSLRTLQHLVCTCQKQGDEDSTHKWREQARTVFENAPEPVQDQYRAWITD